MARLALWLVAVAAVVPLVLAGGADSRSVSARTLSGFPQHFLHPFINFWEFHLDPEDFPKLDGVSRMVGTATMGLLMCLGWLGYLPVKFQSKTDTDRIQYGEDIQKLLRNWLPHPPGGPPGRPPGGSYLGVPPNGRYRHQQGVLARRRGPLVRSWAGPAPQYRGYIRGGIQSPRRPSTASNQPVVAQQRGPAGPPRRGRLSPLG
ncbi:uncharacterized protein LOC122378734 [Amphibalanus amphitrite]|uniref:uncharacterized protein LOC122378734 n=1 Tax=Amphibalanus amphitrite TaxID=1232801 RepID=UPI001C90B93E|nr:uncharacterized protein LOC122378734 [Amphibalanus amphitrite]